MGKENDVNFMRDYLGYAVEMEKYVYIWQVALNKINRSISNVDAEAKNIKARIAQNNRDMSFCEEKVAHEKETFAAEVEESRKNAASGGVYGKFYIKYFSLMLGLGVLAVLFIWGVADKSAIERILNSGVISEILISSIPFFIVLLIVLGASIYISRQSYKGNKEHLDSSYWDDKVISEKKKLSSEIAKNEACLNNCNSKYSSLIAKRNDIHNNLRFAYEARERHYSLNYINSKYQNFPAVATMYEYLVTGRCNQIKGHGGIYDTYEYDAKLGTIITNLIDINNKLDVVIQNQHMLYDEMKITNSHILSIEEGVKNIEKSNNVIAANSAVTAVATQQMSAIAKQSQWEAWARGF